MTLEQKLAALSELGTYLSNFPDELVEVIAAAKTENQWFTKDNCEFAIRQIAQNYLNREKLDAWLSHYTINTNPLNRVGLILAGNIPLVGLHDVLCCFLSGNKSIIKMSDRDKLLLPFILECLRKINPDSSPYFEYVERMEDPDAVIATGSNNSAVYFERYFGKFPHIIRKHRNAIAILDGSESEDEIIDLGKDIFRYFGLGCRNVSKIYLHENFEIEYLMEVLHQYHDVILHNKYKNNYDFNYAIYLLNQEKFLMNGALILREHQDLVSRISCIHYERYTDPSLLVKELENKLDEIQCICSKNTLAHLKTIPLGTAQFPSLTDYADDVDTMQFLLNLKKSQV